MAVGRHKATGYSQIKFLIDMLTDQTDFHAKFGYNQANRVKDRQTDRQTHKQTLKLSSQFILCRQNESILLLL